MRKLILTAMLALPFTAQAQTIPAELKQEVACTVQTVREAVRGDFSNWVLPDFIPGKHLRAGQWAPCMPPLPAR